MSSTLVNQGKSNRCRNADLLVDAPPQSVALLRGRRPQRGRGGGAAPNSSEAQVAELHQQLQRGFVVDIPHQGLRGRFSLL